MLSESQVFFNLLQSFKVYLHCIDVFAVYLTVKLIHFHGKMLNLQMDIQKSSSK